MSNGWRNVAINSAFFHEQFETTKSSSLHFSLEV